MGSHRTGQPETESHHRTGDSDRHVGRRREDRRLRLCTGRRRGLYFGRRSHDHRNAYGTCGGRPHLPTQSRRRSRPHDRFGRTDDRLRDRSHASATRAHLRQGRRDRQRRRLVAGRQGRCGLRLQVRRSRIVHRGRRRRALRHAEGSQRRRADPLHDVRRRATARLEGFGTGKPHLPARRHLGGRLGSQEQRRTVRTDRKRSEDLHGDGLRQRRRFVRDTRRERSPRLPVVQRQRRRGYGQQRSGMRPLLHLSRSRILRSPQSGPHGLRSAQQVLDQSDGRRPNRPAHRLHAGSVPLRPATRRSR